jgi:hypothetical protein
MNDYVNKFWDLYQEDGIEDAVHYAQGESNGDLEMLKDQIEDLIGEAKNRDVDIIKFLEELAEVEARDAIRTTDDAPLLLTDSSDDDGIVEDEAESAEERAPDQPADAGTEES